MQGLRNKTRALFMRGTVGGPRTAANTHSVRIPLAADRVCHQVQLPVQAGALRAAGRRSHWQNQKGKLSSSAVGASACRAPPAAAPLDVRA
jgi:hypothetical protein